MDAQYGTAPDGRAELHRILRDADVVIEASRPRALAALGASAEQVMADGRARVWIRIDGHGPTQDRVRSRWSMSLGGPRPLEYGLGSTARIILLCSRLCKDELNRAIAN